jgi:hypothetical protein
LTPDQGKLLQPICPQAARESVCRRRQRVFLRWLEVEVQIVEVRKELAALVDEHRCKTLAIDMTCVEFIHGEFFYPLNALSKGGVQIELLHPTPMVREVLKLSRMDQLYTVVPPGATRTGPPANASQSTNPTPRRRFEFTLWTIILVITVAAMLIAAGIMALGIVITRGV